MKTNLKLLAAALLICLHTLTHLPVNMGELLPLRKEHWYFPENLKEQQDLNVITSYSIHYTKLYESHSYTVAYLAKQLGKYFGFSDEDCQKLQVSGYLHDIGKIGVDPGLLEKNGPLSDDEFNHVKLHAYYTGQILKNLSRSEWFKDIVLWSQNHHSYNFV